jgi:vesicle coat complex subunit
MNAHPGLPLSNMMRTMVELRDVQTHKVKPTTVEECWEDRIAYVTKSVPYAW